MTVVPVKRILANAKLPVYAHSTDAGMDLFSAMYSVIPSNDMRKIVTGIKMAIPTGHVGLIVDKSSMAANGLHVVAGVVDSAYRGEIIVVIRNLGEYNYVVDEGAKIAQMIIVPIPEVHITETLFELEETDRGEGGFGSTGAM